MQVAMYGGRGAGRQRVEGVERGEVEMAARGVRGPGAGDEGHWAGVAGHRAMGTLPGCYGAGGYGAGGRIPPFLVGTLGDRWRGSEAFPC